MMRRTLSRSSLAFSRRLGIYQGTSRMLENVLRSPRMLSTTSLMEDSPMDLINRVAPIEVDGDIAICDGTDDPRSGLGHPREYIQLKKRSNTPETCKYCGLRYIKSSKSKNSK